MEGFKDTKMKHGGNRVMEGFGFQTKTLDLHIDPERTCVKRDWGVGAGCVTQPELAGPERRASAQEVRVVSVKDNKTMLFC